MYFPLNQRNKSGKLDPSTFESLMAGTMIYEPRAVPSARGTCLDVTVPYPRNEAWIHLFCCSEALAFCEVTVTILAQQPPSSDQACWPPPS